VARPGALRRLTGSTRVRSVAVTVVLLALAIGASVLVSRQLLLSRLDERIDRQLSAEVAELASLASDGVDPATGRPFEDVAAVMRTKLQRSVPDRFETMLSIVGARVDARSAQPPPLRLDADPELVARLAATTQPSLGWAQTTEGAVRYAAMPVTAGDVSGVFVVASFRDLEAAEVHETVGILALVGAGAAVVAGVLAWLLAGRVLRPLRLLAATSSRVSDRSLGDRVPVRGDDDVSDVARTFNAMLDRLQTAFDDQRRFSDDAGHELRTPITIVRGHVELLSPDEEVREQQRALVLDELDRMARMVDDLLTLTRSGQPDFVRPASVDLAELTDELWGKVQALGGRAWLLESRAQGHVITDRQRLTQAFLQLAQNAVQHTREGDRIGVGLRREAGTLRLWVHDSGPGLPVEQRAHVFDRFARGGDARRTGPGVGLGLAIVRAVAVALGGTVRFEDPPDGTGALAVIVVPTETEEEH
jgi:two-component system OmpR family sensor kinase